MARFSYRFATLQRLYESARDDALQKLADAKKALEIIDQRIEENVRAKAALRESRHMALTGQVNVDRLLDRGRYDLQIDVDRRDLQNQRVQIAEEVQRRQQRVQLAEQECRKLDKLEERARANFLAAEQNRQQAELDELASQRPYHIRDEDS